MYDPAGIHEVCLGREMIERSGSAAGSHRYREFAAPLYLLDVLY